MTTITKVRLIDDDCDRCGKRTPELMAFKLSSTITHRGRVIEYPWLCLKCFVAEKKKWWATKQGEMS